MPLYEYTCRPCGHFFELLVRPGTVPACPSCQSQDLERALSVFAVDSEDPREQPFETLASAPRSSARRKEQIGRASCRERVWNCV